MYLRILKRSLCDNIALNITLFIFMILAAIFVTISANLLYTSVVMGDKTYELCNTSDMTLVTDTGISKRNNKRDAINKWFEELSDYDKMYMTQRAIYPGTMVMIKNEDKELSPQEMMITSLNKDYNIPYDLHNNKLVVENGCVALPQNLMDNMDVRIGDVICFTSQMGNVYEFTVSDFYKDPSAYIYDRLIFSDADYALLMEESPVKSDVYEIFLKETDDNYGERKLKIEGQLYNTLEESRLYGNKERYTTNDGIIGLVVALVLSLVGIFMIAMIFLTIRFSLKSAIKREEKEIGIMKAIGVYSFSYRALFAVKYIAFAIAGGIIGIPIALPLSKILLNRFMIHILLPTDFMAIVLAFASVSVTVLVIVGFTFFSLRYMNKITVMDAIHGENKGENFRKLPGLFLHKNNRISIPFFLALGDILGKLKRYAYLILAYVTGVCMVLLVIQVKDSICSMDYVRRYWQINALEFNMEIDDSYYQRLYDKEGNSERAIKSINDKFAENEIPAKIEFFSTQMATVEFNGKEFSYVLAFGEPDTTEITYTEGSTPPLLSNEIAINCFSAKHAGIELGDIISVEYSKYNDDGTSYKKVKEDFVVTGFVDGVSLDYLVSYMGNDFSGAVVEGQELFQTRMDCAKGEYQMYFDKMDDLYTDDEIKFKNKSEAMDEYMSGFNDMFNLIIIVVSSVVAIILTLITILYENIFIEEETADVALLKSMGFEKGTIKLWHTMRFLILMAMSCVVAVLLSVTIGNLVVAEIINQIIHVYDFQMVVRFLANFVVVPICTVSLIAISLLPVLKSMDKIQIWRVRDE